MSVVNGRRASEAGITLIEVLVSMVILGVVGAVALAMVLLVRKDLLRSDDEAQGLSDVRVASERLARDLRQASGVVVSSDPTYTATQSQLTVWVDANNDYIQQDNETVTWRLVPGFNGHYDLVRALKSGSSAVEARTVVQQVAFSYCLAITAGGVSCTTSPTAGVRYSSVNVSIQYDPLVGTGSGQKQVTFRAEMRNVA